MFSAVENLPNKLNQWVKNRIKCVEQCRFCLCKYRWKNETLNQKKIWMFYSFLTLLLVCSYVFGDILSHGQAHAITQYNPNGQSTQEFLLKELLLDTKVDLSTIERVDIWSSYLPRSQERVSRDPCMGFDASLQTCVKEFEHVEPKRFVNSDILLMSEFNYTNDRLPTYKGISELCDILGIAPEKNGERHLTLESLYRAAQVVQFCKQKSEMTGGLCEEQIVAARLYSILHKGYSVKNYDRVTLKKVQLNDPQGIKREYTFVLHTSV